MRKTLLVFASMMLKRRDISTAGNPFKTLTTTALICIRVQNQGNDLGYSKNVKDWEIRIQASYRSPNEIKLEGSTTKRCRG